MTFRQVEFQKEFFVQSYIALENIRNIVHWNCCCQIHDGCPTIENVLNRDKRYCCYCQFVDLYNFDLLHKIKRDINFMKALYNEILAVVKVLKLYKNVNQFVSNYDVFYPACFIEKLTEERRRELKEFLFHSGASM